MKILFVILTCEQYRKTRRTWQEESWLWGICDAVYLNTPPAGEQESYYCLSKKYLEFLQTSNCLDYDWYFFCDDDTYVFVDKLKTFLSLFNSEENILIGSELADELVKKATINCIRACSGGAGIAISNLLFKNIKEYLFRGEYDCLREQADISLALWANACCWDLKVVDAGELFRPNSPKHHTNWGLNYPITFHYCDEEDFEYCYRLEKQTI